MKQTTQNRKASPSNPPPSAGPSASQLWFSDFSNSHYLSNFVILQPCREKTLQVRSCSLNQQKFSARKVGKLISWKTWRNGFSSRGADGRCRRAGGEGGWSWTSTASTLRVSTELAAKEGRKSRSFPSLWMRSEPIGKLQRSQKQSLPGHHASNITWNTESWGFRALESPFLEEESWEEEIPHAPFIFIRTCFSSSKSNERERNNKRTAAQPLAMVAGKNGKQAGPACLYLLNIPSRCLSYLIFNMSFYSIEGTRWRCNSM